MYINSYVQTCYINITVQWNPSYLTLLGRACVWNKKIQIIRGAKNPCYDKYNIYASRKTYLPVKNNYGN